MRYFLNHSLTQFFIILVWKPETLLNPGAGVEDKKWDEKEDLSMWKDMLDHQVNKWVLEQIKSETSLEA